MLLSLVPVRVLAHQGFTGPILNFIPVTGKSILDPKAVKVLPPNFFVKGSRLSISLSLNVSCVSSPTFTFIVKMGSIPAFSSGPIQCLPGQYLNAELVAQFNIRLDTEGSPNKASFTGDFDLSGPMFGPYPPLPVTPTGSFGSLANFPPLNQPFPRIAGMSGWMIPSTLAVMNGLGLAGTPPGAFPSTYPIPSPPTTLYPTTQVSTVFDSGAFNALDIWVACNPPDFGNSVQVVDYIVEDMSPTQPITVADSVLEPV